MGNLPSIPEPAAVHVPKIVGTERGVMPIDVKDVKVNVVVSPPSIKLEDSVKEMQSGGAPSKGKKKASGTKGSTKGSTKGKLDNRTVDKLVERARALNIKGRSKLDKKGLVKAIRDKNNGKSK